MFRVIAVVVTALAIAAGASAAASGWTPGQIRSALLSPAAGVPYSGAWPYGNSTFESPAAVSAGTVQSGICRGLGTPQGGIYAVFSCSVIWHLKFKAASQQMTLWVRPLSPTAVCVTPISVGACPPPLPAHPLPGDPRSCSGSLVRCTVTAAMNAASQELRSENQLGVNYGCQATTAFVYKCVGLNGSNPLTVRFVAGKSSWSTIVSHA